MKSVNNFNTSRLYSAIAIGCAMFSSNVQATALEELVVTAQKREQNLQEVPISISAISEESIETIGVAGDDIRVLSARVANLNIESTFGRTYPRFYVRGLGNSDFALNAQQSVELYYDEVVLSNPIIKGMPIFDIGQVEVLRGPQGTLWGRNSTAGAVHVISKKPAHEFEGKARVSYGRFNTINTEAAVGGSLVEDELAGRISVLYQSQDDWVDNLVTGNEVGAYTDSAMRAQLLWTPNEQFSALLQGYTRSYDGVAALFHSTAEDPDFGRQAFEKDKIALDNDAVPFQDIDMNGVNLRLEYSVGNLDFNSLTSFISAESSTVGDIDATGLPALINADVIDDITQFTQEFRLADNSRENLRWQIGFYYFDEDLEYANTTANNAFQIPANPGPFDLGQPGDPGFGAFQRVSQNLQSWAVFGQVEFDLTERATLTAGLRYSDDETEASRVTGQFTPNPNNLGGIPNFNTAFYDPSLNRGPISLFGAPTSQTNQLASEEITWDLSLNYKANDNINLYARVATGYHGGVIEAGGPFSSFDTADPETILSFEVGMKAFLLDQRMRANLSLFRYDYDDQQLQGFEDTGNGGFTARLLNADGGTGQGIEAELEFSVNDNLTIFGNIGYVDTEIDGDTFFSTTDGTIVNLNGRRFPFAPEITGAVLLEYSKPLDNGSQFYISTDWSYRDEVDTRFTSVEEPRFTVDGYWEGAARAGIRNDKFDIGIWARNITDETGSTSVLSVVGFESHSFNGPRLYGVDFSIKF
ncbi:TonB-dependent receptor [Porticoccus sp. W117]|uniref:TonB-dependent receptor n=1 Tax=Porticoccus sp. W117 TaxID=3054777 RepID=UPI0025979C49|nr:TonB-dependent receptor [Porticoccus sp. W117]MDM3872619.1 TonB-dependent receptor [Porticoccus sp. W117]